ncbi:MAG: TGS domain-containing protein [Firmicutes bacterium]|nr:TGS domain-containing protein [Bacillota bacterium]
MAPLSEDGARDFRQVYDEVTVEVGLDLPSALVATKADLEGAASRWAVLARTLGDIASARCSVATGEGLEEVRGLIWDVCGLKRVYCNPKGRSVSPEAVVLPPEGTVRDLVAALNRAWLERFQQARVSGRSARFPGQAMGPGHVLADGDVVELTVR